MPHITDILEDSGHACNPADQQEEDEEETKNEECLHAVLRLASQRLTVEVFDKPAVKLLSCFSIFSFSTAQLPTPPPDLPSERWKRISHETVVCVFPWAYMSACLSAGQFHYPVINPLQKPDSLITPSLSQTVKGQS